MSKFRGQSNAILFGSHYCRVSKDFLYERDLSFEKDLQTNNKAAPWKSFFTSKDALKINLRIEDVHNRLFTVYFSEAFSIHAPDELPLLIKHEEPMNIEGGKMYEVLITPEVITTDEDLKSSPLDERSCYLDGEKQLKFYKAYTKRNCEIECFSNASVEVCGCVSFDVIRDSETQICGVHSIECLTELKYSMKYSVDNEMMKSCNCLTTCDSIAYNYELIETKYTEK